MDELEHAVIELDVECGTEDTSNRLLSFVSSLEGVESVSYENGTLRVIYCPHCVLGSWIEEQVAGAGFRPVKPGPSRKRGIIGRFLDNLAASNEEAFGSKPLDCCTIGREKKPR